MRFYPAGASAEIELIEGFRDRLIAAGHEITCDWMKAVRDANNVASPDDMELCARAAKADLRGVEDADIFWIIMPPETSSSTGAWVELGWALCMKESLLWHQSDVKRPLVVVSGSSKKCIFRTLADVNFLDHEDAFAYISSAGKEIK